MPGFPLIAARSGHSIQTTPPSSNTVRSTAFIASGCAVPERAQQLFAPSIGSVTRGFAVPPYINQEKPAGATGDYVEGDYVCGPTCLAMIARVVGYGADLDEVALIRHLAGIAETNSDTGTSLDGIQTAADHMSLASVRNDGADVAWIADRLRTGHFCVVNGEYYAMRPHEDPTKREGHYVLVYGLDPRGGFFVHDPADPAVRRILAPELRRYLEAHETGGHTVAIATSVHRPRAEAGATLRERR